MTVKSILHTYELAKKFDCTQRTIRRMLDRGELPGFKIGGIWRIKSDELDDILKKRHTKSDKSDSFKP